MTTTDDEHHLIELRRGQLRSVPLLWVSGRGLEGQLIYPESSHVTQDRYCLGMFRRRVQFTLEVQDENGVRLEELLASRHLFDLGLTSHGALIRMALLFWVGRSEFLAVDTCFNPGNLQELLALKFLSCQEQFTCYYGQPPFDNFGAIEFHQHSTVREWLGEAIQVALEHQVCLKTADFTQARSVYFAQNPLSRWLGKSGFEFSLAGRLATKEQDGVIPF